ncbi:type II toxin-antitoxin system RelE family toxin [Vagococcus silagei]|uniref:Type II toxin-antitoxin system RelE/ParE family toxin n=1 Tax=Vagococcus silagei TaxID=2508885 RepID=A0A4S3B639_9ENTE|nr:type II toxin-antitoxin system RelE/ParE family toxin [Vagococcus silagei]THB62048.1 type II toxin-antitoxin system RelE/ParE family toxin [Vagococcus silagei]
MSKKYSVRYEKSVIKKLKRMDKHQASLILSWISKNLEGTEFPRYHGKSLVGNKSSMWRYRVGDYRLLADINDETITILLLEIGHRKDIYK